MPAYSIRLEGDTRRLLRKMRSLSDIDKRSINAAMAEGVRESTLERFKQSKDPSGKRWKTSIRAAESGGKTLIKTSNLRTSIKSEAAPMGFAVGTNLIYAGTHQFGASGRTIRAKNAKLLKFKVGGRFVSKQEVKVDIPARPFLGLSDDDMDEIKATLEDYLERET